MLPTRASRATTTTNGRTAVRSYDMIDPFYVCRISTCVESTLLRLRSATPWVDSVDVPSVTATASPPALTPRRRELLEAALHVVADEGLRGLTHRAVDRRAGLPEGTCSAYFRTRQALQARADRVRRRDAGRGRGRARRRARSRARATRRGRSALTLALFERWLDERELLRGQARAVAGGAARPGARRGPDRLAHPAGGRRRRRSCRRRHRSTATARAEALVASFDGLLIARPAEAAARTPARFLSGSLALVLHALSAGPSRDDAHVPAGTRSLSPRLGPCPKP